MTYDPEDDAADYPLEDVEELEPDEGDCSACGEPLTAGECTNQMCPESPDYYDADAE